jgi:hypothetical protein
MTAPIIARKTLTETDILSAIADAISRIKSEDRLSWKDIGRVVDKHHDQVPKYADGSAKMDVVSFALARRTWGSRFTGQLDHLLDGVTICDVSDRACEGKVLRAALAMSEALSDDEIIVDHEVRKNRSTLEAARDAIDAQLAKLGPKGMRA